jgi:hypothetical protein
MLPEIEIVHPDVDPALPPELFTMASELSRRGVPRSILIGRFRASPRIVLTSGLLEIGRFGFQVIGVEPSTGRVQSVVDDGPPHFVNSSFEHFVEVARRVTRRFPFYSAAEQDAEIRALPSDGGVAPRAARSVGSIVAEVDAPAISRASFWSGLVDDIYMGDLVTEDVLASEDI